MAVEVKTDADIKSTLEDNEKVVVKYYADWCGNCRLFSPKFKRLSNDGRFSDVAFLDVNAENNPESRKLAGVTNLPFFATFKNGELVGCVSASKEEKVVELIEGLS
ncbi:MAG: thioredoxin family protein [Bacteroidota bacterium]